MEKPTAWGVTLYDIGTGAEVHSFSGDDLPLPFPTSPGTGIILGAHRWRIVDRWMSFDNHGRHDHGLHVWMELVTDTDDDRPGLAEYDYYH